MALSFSVKLFEKHKHLPCFLITLQPRTEIPQGQGLVFPFCSGRHPLGMAMGGPPCTLSTRGRAGAHAALLFTMPCLVWNMGNRAHSQVHTQMWEQVMGQQEKLSETAISPA